MNKPPDAPVWAFFAIILVLVIAGVCAIRFPRPIYVFLVNGNVAAPFMSKKTLEGSSYYDWGVRLWGFCALCFAGFLLYLTMLNIFAEQHGQNNAKPSELITTFSTGLQQNVQPDEALS